LNMADKCTQCGICCELFLINLTEEEYKSGKYETQFQEFGIVDDFIEAEMGGANIIAQKDDSSCIYLIDGKCSIHQTRPQSCENFFCTSNDPKFSSMIDKINDKKSSIKNSSQHVI